MKSTPAILTAFVLAFILSACGGGSGSTTVHDADGIDAEVMEPDAEPAAPEPTAPDACTLLAGIDIAVLLGEEPGTPSDAGGICKITAADTDSTGAILVQAVPAPKGAEYYERDKGLLGSDGEIAGLGDAAHYAGPYRVNVLSGDNYLIVQVIRELFGDVERLDDALLIDATRTVLTNTGW